MTDAARIEDLDHHATIRYYDDFAAHYAAHVPDWKGSIERQAGVLHRIITRAIGADRASILDCTCGVGTQSIGLAALGHDVVGSDASRAAIREARHNALRHGVDASFEMRDIRDLGGIGRVFDAVLSIDNSLPHLLTDTDLIAASRGMLRCLRPGGVVVISVRDYDRHREARPRATLPQVWDTADGIHVAFQVWDWVGDDCYQAEQFVLRQADGAWQMSSFRGATYRAWRREDITKTFRAAGFGRVDWQLPNETGFHQPLAIASHSR